jgi:hypothetical protein
MRFQDAKSGIPVGSYAVDAEALKRARAGVPKGEYH